MLVITSGCNTVVEELSILVEKTYPLADRFNSKIKDTNNMLEIIDDINKSMLSENCVLVSFDVVNMLPNIDNKSSVLSVKEALTDSNFNIDSTQCIVDALEICLTRSNSKLNLNIFCKLMVQHRALIYLVPLLTLPWPSMTLLPINSISSLVFGKDLEMMLLYYGNMALLLFSFLDYLNAMDKAGKIKFTMEIAGDTALEFLNLNLKINEGKIRVHVYTKSTNSFS